MDEAIGSNADVPFITQLRQDEYAGPLFGRVEAVQAFIAKRPMISRVGFVAGTYMRTNTQDVLVSIEDQTGKIVERAANPARFEDNGWVLLDMPAPITVGREYRLKISIAGIDTV